MHRTSLILTFLIAAAMAGCRETVLENPSSAGSSVSPAADDSPQELLVGVLDELDRISKGLPAGRLDGSSRTLRLAKEAAETTYVYGALTSDGYGAVVTERHTNPKGIQLVTVRTTYGMGGNVIVSQLDRYITKADFEARRPEQSVRTEVVGLSADTILTRIVRNNQLETHTFRLPVVTVSLKSEPGLSRTVSRYALRGELVVETRDGNGQFLQLRRSSTLQDGSLITMTEYADGSWRRTRTVGRSDGTILHEVSASE